LRAPYQTLILPYRQHSPNDLLEFAVFLRADGDNDVWQFIAGGGEEGESRSETAVRELFEETGVRFELPLVELDSQSSIPANVFSAWKDWDDDVLVVTEYAYGVDIANREIELSHEHTEFRWVDFETAMGLLRFDSNRTALWELNTRLGRGL
jgi:dATP pyrophosphohydrolase